MSMTISKWGNSLGIRIPLGVAKEAGIGLGAPVRVSAQKGRIIVEPVVFDLETLVKGITPKNRHHEIETGPPVGEEAW
jgi:antitoxin MazE